MHDIWNPWHGCVKISEGCQHCYMYYLDQQRGRNGAEISKTKTGMGYPLRKNRYGEYLVHSGERLRVCMTSDFFLEQADSWRDEAWDVIRARKDVLFQLLTKRPGRVLEHLPQDWGDGWPNVSFSVTCENQRRADERLPLLLSLPFRHKGVMCAPFIGEVALEAYLQDGQIEQVICGGENYDGARPCRFEWVQSLHDQCKRHDVRFCFIETGTVFIKDGKVYRIPNKRTQSVMAFRSRLQWPGKPVEYSLEPPSSLLPVEPYAPTFGEQCQECGSRLICNGCSRCGKCK
ncbi:MAG: DUF5131 family protein [Eubacteriales bacterium]|nr:DUF5131 family protein [Eubacteriales bacterium]